MMVKARKKQQTEQAELNRLMEAMREEVAREFGLSGADSVHFADLSSRICGKFGHTLRQRAKEISQQMQEEMREVSDGEQDEVSDGAQQMQKEAREVQKGNQQYPQYSAGERQMKRIEKGRSPKE
jgi:hypothetical protein